VGKHGKTTVICIPVQDGPASKKIHGVQLSNEKAKTFLQASRDAYRRASLARLFLVGLLLPIGAAFYVVVILSCSPH
jgi:hypothetical protein